MSCSSHLDVLVAASLDYGAAGDYNLVEQLVDYEYASDYDYGQPRLIPETAVSGSAVRSRVDEDLGR
jgi:hypothetical protein